MRRKHVIPLVTLFSLSALTGCSSSLPIVHPDPVDLSQFNQSNTLFDVVGVVGEPQGSIVNLGETCEIYRIYTHGLNKAEKAGVAFAQGITDIGTLGIAQLVVWGPVHAAGAPRIHTVMFCFDKNTNLMDLYDKNPANDDPVRHLILNQAGYNAAMALPAITIAQPIIASAAPSLLPDLVSGSTLTTGAATGAVLSLAPNPSVAAKDLD